MLKSHEFCKEIFANQQTKKCYDDWVAYIQKGEGSIRISKPIAEEAIKDILSKYRYFISDHTPIDSKVKNELIEGFLKTLTLKKRNEASKNL